MRILYQSFRKGQREAIEFLKSGLGNYVALRAPPGYGKTLVALAGHLGSGRVIYVVRTRNEIAPVVREMRKLGGLFTVVFSGRRMCPLVRGVDIPSEDFWLNCRILRLRNMCPYFLNLKKVSQSEVIDLLTQLEEVDPHRIAASVVRKFSVCSFFTLSGLASKVDVAIATYPHLFNENIYSLAFPEIGLDEFYVVVDEAHTLIFPQSVLSDFIDVSTLVSSSSELDRSSHSELARRVRQIEEVLRRVDTDKLARVSKQSIGVDQDFLSELKIALQDIRLTALSSLELIGVENFVKTTSSISRVLRFLSLAVRDYFSLYAQRTSGGQRLYALPLGYEPIRERLRPARGVLLMSGTLPPKNVLDSVVGRETKYLDVEASYGQIFPRENIFYAVYTAVTTSYPQRSTKMFMEYAKLVRSIYDSVERAILAVYPSYEVMEEVVRYVELPNSQYVESEKTSVGDVVKTVLSNPHTLINAVASGKIVEGIEFRDSSGSSLVDSVVVCGIPYPYPDDYIEDFRATLRRDLGGFADTLAMDVQASMRVLQACGRAIRSESDRAFVVLADRRYLKSGFRELLGIQYDAVFSDAPSLLSKLRGFFALK
ncbi:MAG: ATP-dependent DNA helicase [Sulfolobales archaeon]|nr:ATP-dependent DNA helicase [Sulfolobales archaeon]MDW8082681.1 ATP-dependent DNA helicase [Sulfolobales archaeon]